MVMNILWYDNTNLAKPGSGQQTKTITLLNILSRFVHIILLCPCKPTEFSLHNVDIVPISDVKGFESFFSYDLAKKFLSLIRKNRPDLIVFSHIYGAPTILMLKSNIPAVYDSHAVELELAMGGSLRSIVVVKILEEFSLRLSDKIITLSESDKSSFKLYYNVNDHKLVVIPPPRLNMQCSNEEILAGKQYLAREYGEDLLEKNVLVFHGSLRYGPNSEAVVHILRDIAPALSNKAVFLIVGPDPPYLGRVNNVIFTGFVKDLRRVLCAADAAVVPLKRVTGVNMKVLEYISYGLPIFASQALLRWLNLKEVEGSVIISSIEEMPLNIKKALASGLIRTRWRREISYNEVTYSYLNVFKEVVSNRS